MRGRDILQKEYPENEIRMRTYLNYLINDKDKLIKSIVNFQEKIIKIDAELENCLNMTLEDWIKEH